MPTVRYISRSGGTLTDTVPTVTSLGSSSGGQLVALNAAGQLDMTLLPTGVGANAVTATASAAISAGQLINVYSNAGVLSCRPADSTTTGSQADGFAPYAIANGVTGTIYLGPGMITGLSGLTIGSTYYLASVGGISSTVPATVGNIVQVVGKALSSTSLDFQPSTNPITVA